MPNNSSAAKRHRQSLKHRERNRSARSSVRTANKKFLEAVAAKDKDEAQKRFQTFMKMIDTAAGKGIYKKNMVARKKSRMHRLLNTLEEG